MLFSSMPWVILFAIIFMHEHYFDLSGTVHTIVGIFKKKTGGTWGHGLEILNELLDTIEKSGLLEEVRGVYISLLGTEADRSEARAAISSRKKVFVVVESSKAEYAEFPGLNALQLYANATDPYSRLLYMHTKGVRKNGFHPDYPVMWRRYMTYFLVEKYHACLTALKRKTQDHQSLNVYTGISGYQTCGVLKQNSIYQGNFWWSTAGWFSQRRPLISDLDWATWSTGNRYAAEEYILKDVPGDQSAHYCIHHTHHCMQCCPTHREMYENVSVAFRATPNCFNPTKMKPNPTKDPKTFCHSDTFPIID
jgi:hypothetical protein